MFSDNIVFSGFKNEPTSGELLNKLLNKYNISKTIDNNTKYIITKNKDDIDSYTKSSAKVKLAIQYKIPFITENELDNLLKLI